MSVVIKAENISKLYHIGSKTQLSFRESVENAVKKILHKPSAETDEFWALKDVNFEMKEGEVLGIIGKNGAGKSTLMKILSRVTSPTTGRILIKGRISSLLEVGTGFHPELTGRENIFLNGTIMGMKRDEIRKKFDQIVEFSGVESFIDTAVKRYSSGMYVRLAFSVAAHLEPEILVVDEVLSVGDASFQQKCLGKMKDVANKGRTVLFVSHQMASIQNLCTRAILMRNGRVNREGSPFSVIDYYLNGSADETAVPLLENNERSGNGDIRFTAVSLLDQQKKTTNALYSGQNCAIRVSFVRKNPGPLTNFHLAFGIDDQTGYRLSVFSNEVTHEIFPEIDENTNSIDIVIEHLPLPPGKYHFSLFSRINNDIADWVQHAGTFNVESGDFFLSGKLPQEGMAAFYIKHHFETASE